MRTLSLVIIRVADPDPPTKKKDPKPTSRKKNRIRIRPLEKKTWILNNPIWILQLRLKNDNVSGVHMISKDFNGKYQHKYSKFYHNIQKQDSDPESGQKNWIRIQQNFQTGSGSLENTRIRIRNPSFIRKK